MRHAAVLGATVTGVFLAFGAEPVLPQASNSSTSQRPAAASAPPAKPASTPESRSAAALALSQEPVYDAGTYERLKEALLSYADLQVRGGWPTLPADAKLAPGASGPNVALLRRRLVITEDLASDKRTGDTYDDTVIEGVKRFQLRHGLEATGLVGHKR